MRALVVGELFHPNQLLWPEGAVYTVTPQGHNLVLFVDEPAPAHVSDVAEGEVELGLYVNGPIVLLLCRFGESFAWSDAPLHWGRVAPAADAAPRLAVALVDAFSGLVRALRSEPLPAAFAAELSAAVGRAAAGRWPGDEAFDGALKALYAGSPGDELAARAAVRCELPARDSRSL